MACADVRCRAGFSLIELLVVIGIIALLSSMIMFMPASDRRRVAVTGAANQLAATLRKAKALAIQTQSMHAVVFNLQNQPDSSGAVLNNRSGGHWYRILGPNRFAQGRVNNAVPIVAAGRQPQGYYLHFPWLTRAIEESWVGDIQTLPAGKVRFLALSDTDEGPRAAGVERDVAGQHTWYPTTYPRPWFGFFDDATKTLHPWGGYDPSRNYSAFYYEGLDGDISGSRNPTDYLVNVPAGGNYETTVANQPIWTAGSPRAVINADWADFGIAFTPDGRAMALPWLKNRRSYRKGDIVGAGGEDTWDLGVRDRTRNQSDAARTNADIGPYQTHEAVHFTAHHGGWFVTLAPDVPTDQTLFANADEALRSMMPMVRVHVSAQGDVRVIPVKLDPGLLSSRTPWPSSPAVWQQSTANNEIWQWCRFGFFGSHYFQTGSSASFVRSANGDGYLSPANDAGYIEPDRFRPAGSAITDRINTTMLTQRIWWLK